MPVNRRLGGVRGAVLKPLKCRTRIPRVCVRMRWRNFFTVFSAVLRALFAYFLRMARKYPNYL